MSLDEPVIPWSDELAYCIAANKAIGDVDKYQESYVCYASTGYMCEASDLSVIRTHGSAQPITARLDIVTAPAEYCLPIKKDRRFAPEFTVQVTLGTSAAANLPAKVLACPFSETHRRSLSGPLRQRLPQFLVNEALGRSQPASAEDRQKWYLSFKGQTTTHLDFDSNRDTVPHTGGSQIVMQKRGTFTGLEYLKSSHMERVYLLFVMTIGDSPDIIATLFSVPTIVICRASQRRLATERLGYPLSVYDDLRSRGCSYNLPSRKPGAMPPSPATPGRAAAAAAAAAVAAASAGVLDEVGHGGVAAPPPVPTGIAVPAAVPLGSVAAAGIALLGNGGRRVSGGGASGALSPMAMPMRTDGRGTIFDLTPQPPDALAVHNGRAVSAPPAAHCTEGRAGSDEERTQDERAGGGGHRTAVPAGHITGNKRMSGEAAAAAVAGAGPHGATNLVWLQGPAPMSPGALKPAEDLTAKVARVGNSKPTTPKADGAADRAPAVAPAALLKALPEKLLQGLVQFYEDQQKGRAVAPQTQMDAMAALQKLQAAEAAAAAAAAAPALMPQPSSLRPWRLAPKVEPGTDSATAQQLMQRGALPQQAVPSAAAAVARGAGRGQQASPVSDASALSAFAQKRLSSSRASGPGLRRPPDITVSNVHFELPVNSDILAAHTQSTDVLSQIAAATAAAAAGPTNARGPATVKLPNAFAERPVRSALEFFYSGRATLDAETVLPTLAVASHLESPALVTYCLDHAVELVTGLLSRWLPAHGLMAAAGAANGGQDAAAAVPPPAAALPALSTLHASGQVGGADALGLLRVDHGAYPSLTDIQVRGTPMSRTPHSGGGGGARVDAFDAVLERYDPHMSGKAAGVAEATGARRKTTSTPGSGDGMSRVELLLRTYDAARRVSTGGDASGRSTGTAVVAGHHASPRKVLEPAAATFTARRSSGTGGTGAQPALNDSQAGQPAGGPQGPPAEHRTMNGMHALAEAATAVAASMHGRRTPATPPHAHSAQHAAMLASALGRRTSGTGASDSEPAPAASGAVAAPLSQSMPTDEHTRQALDLLARIVGNQQGRALQAAPLDGNAFQDAGGALEAARRLMRGDGGNGAAAAAAAHPAVPASTAANADGAPVH
eukprot:jgi/Ulvmu1/11226/UM072_0063.1